MARIMYGYSPNEEYPYQYPVLRGTTDTLYCDFFSVDDMFMNGLIFIVSLFHTPTLHGPYFRVNVCNLAQVQIGAVC
jgi:hypothetical protein